MKYQPLGTSVLDLNWLLAELYKISDTVNSDVREILHAAPDHLVEGLVVIADGVDWDPLTLSGTTAYMVMYNGTAWQAI